MAQIFAGFFAEGTTDHRFLLPIIEKTLTEIAFDECNGQHDIELIPINIERTGYIIKERDEGPTGNRQSAGCRIESLNH